MECKTLVGTVDVSREDMHLGGESPMKQVGEQAVGENRQENR